MKALTLTQPWATLVAIGAKQIETRGWSTDYRGPLAIHAAKGLKRTAVKFAHLCCSEPFWTYLKGPDAPELPRGCVIATCELVGIVRIEAHMLNPITISPVEFAFGDYTPGRYAWLLGNVEPLAEPEPARGSLGLWEWDR